MYGFAVRSTLNLQVRKMYSTTRIRFASRLGSHVIPLLTLFLFLSSPCSPIASEIASESFQNEKLETESQLLGCCRLEDDQ